MAGGRYRWRTAVRKRLPWFLVNRAWFAKGRRDCGDHEYYRHTDDVDRCYHCDMGESPHDPARFG